MLSSVSELMSKSDMLLMDSEKMVNHTCHNFVASSKWIAQSLLYIQLMLQCGTTITVLPFSF